MNYREAIGDMCAPGICCALAALAVGGNEMASNGLNVWAWLSIVIHVWLVLLVIQEGETADQFRRSLVKYEQRPKWLTFFIRCSMASVAAALAALGMTVTAVLYAIGCLLGVAALKWAAEQAKAKEATP